MNAVEMRGISKRYPLVQALDDVDFVVERGEIHALLGENGAGKSTLMNVLYGMTRPDEGMIRVWTKQTKISHPADAIRLGIGMVHQHSMLAPAMTVTENVILGAEPMGTVLVDWREARDKVEKLISHYKIDAPPDAPVEKLTVGQRQQVEILRAMYRGAKLLILDEPTAAMTPQDIGDLFSVMRRLRDEGRSIVLITHKLAETVEVAGRASILKQGKMIGSGIDVRRTSVNELAKMMVGRNVDTGVRRVGGTIGAPLLTVRELNYATRDRQVLRDINLTVHRGEIFGIAGLNGNGQTELVQALTGQLKPDSMELKVGETPVVGDTADFIRAGIGLIPPDREAQGLIPGMTVEENMILGYHRQAAFSRHGWLLPSNIRSYTKALARKYDVRPPSVTEPCAALSDGNQQKVVLARVLSQDPEVIIAARPTLGVDIGATEFIHKQLRHLRDSGKAILLLSSDLDEVSTLSDHMAVIYKGHLVAEGTPEEIDETEAGMYMTGARAKREVPA